MLTQSITPEISIIMSEQYQRELLEVILGDQTIYPWDPSNPEAEAYFSQLEEDVAFLDCLDQEMITMKSDSFFSCLNQVWPSSPLLKVKQALIEKFGNFVPNTILQAIAEQATQILSANLAPIEQLVQCVKPLLSHWDEEDLQVFARPYAYAMRGTNSPVREFNLNIVQQEWQKLSSVEQARLSMVIANYALTQALIDNNFTDLEDTQYE